MDLKNFVNLGKSISQKNIYMIIGNWKKNQFKDLRKVKGIVNKICSEISDNSGLLYFGDAPDKYNPDVGYVFELISKIRKDITIYMIQIKEAKEWGFPKFVNYVIWHSDYTDKCKWGGLENNKPCSNTKKWVDLHKLNGITKIFILGGGEITLQEYYLLKKCKIKYQYYPVERKYRGDGKTRITNDDKISVKIGITYGKIHNT